MTDLLLDLRYAFRSLIGTPVFTVVTVLVRFGHGLIPRCSAWSTPAASAVACDDPDRSAVIWSNHANSTAPRLRTTTATFAITTVLPDLGGPYRPEYDTNRQRRR
jgi:hypothetical protein